MDEFAISGAVFGLALGDAYGARSEFRPFSEITAITPFGPLFPKSPSSARVTDDTQMALATMNGLRTLHRTTDGRLNITAIRADLIAALAAWANDSRNTPDRAPGQASLSAAQKYASGEKNWQEVAYPNGAGAGAVVRAPWIAFTDASDGEIVQLAMLQGVLTHAHPSSVIATVLATVLTRQLAKGEIEAVDVLDTAITLVMDLSASVSYDDEILSDAYIKFGQKIDQTWLDRAGYLNHGWNENLIALKRAKRNARKLIADTETWALDPCQLAGEGGLAHEALAVAALITSVFAEDETLAVRRAVVTNGASATIAALVGVFVGATGFDWSPSWKEALEPDYFAELEDLVQRLTARQA